MEAEPSQWRRAAEAETSQWFSGPCPPPGFHGNARAYCASLEADSLGTWSVAADDMMNAAQRVAWALLAPAIALIITLLTLGQHTAMTLSHACLHAISFLYATY